MAQLELKVGGAIYGGWTSLAVERGIEQLSGSFTLQLTERWPGVDAGRPVKPGQACVVTIGGEPVVTGFIDEVAPTIDASTRTLAVSGRDATADLVDCSAIHGAGQWKGASLARLARDLCTPFKIAVVIDPAVQALADKAFPSWNIEEGETVFDCLERAARMRTVLLTTRGDGALFITRPGFDKAQTRLVEGENIISAEGRFTWAERFSEYRVKGQSRDSHTDKGTSRDKVVTRYRPLIVLAEDQAAGVTAQQRADWEMTLRAGRSNRATVTVQGWQQGNGLPLWQPNLRVGLSSSVLRADGELLVASVSYTLNDSGERTVLSLVDPRAFDRLAGVRATRLKQKFTGKSDAASKGGNGTPGKVGLNQADIDEIKDWGQN